MDRLQENSPSDDGPEIVQTVAAAADVLQALADHTSPMSLAQLGRKLGMTSPRVLRHLTTLVALGFVERTGQEPLYSLGWRLARLGDRAVRQHDLVHVGYPFLKDLRDAVGHTVALARNFDGRALVWLCMEGAKPPYLTVPPGTELSMHATSSGRVLLAYMDEDARERRLQASLDPTDLPDPIIDKAILRGRLAEIRQRGFDLHGSTGADRMFGMAAPVYDHLGKVAASVSVIGITNLRAGPHEDLVRPLVEATHKFSRALGADL